MRLGLTPEQESLVRSQKRMGMALSIMEYVALQGSHGATSDECSSALKLVVNAASARYSELARVGCLVATQAKRKTKSGGLAIVHVVPKDSSFVPYLTFPFTTRGKKSAAGLSTLEQAVLSAGLTFLKRWEKQPEKHSEAATKLLKELLHARHLSG